MCSEVGVNSLGNPYDVILISHDCPPVFGEMGKLPQILLEI